MNVKTIILSLFFFFISIITCYARPVIFFENKTHDFGTVKVNSIVKYSFRFKNTGDSVLIIDRIKSGCSCTVILLSDKETQAGGSGVLDVELNTEDQDGDLIRTISVYSNDQKKPLIKLTVKAYVVK